MNLITRRQDVDGDIKVFYCINLIARRQEDDDDNDDDVTDHSISLHVSMQCMYLPGKHFFQ